MPATITIEVSAGSAIELACKDAQRIADLLGINCAFDFNGVKCLAIPGGSSEDLAERQQEQQSRKSLGPFDRRFASSRSNREPQGCAA